MRKVGVAPHIACWHGGGLVAVGICHEAARAALYHVLAAVGVMRKHICHHAVVEEIVAGVPEQHPVARCGLHAFVHGVVDASVGLRHGVGEAVGIAGYDACGAVGAAAVYHDVLEIAVRLPQHVLHRPFHKGGAVVRNGDDGYFGLRVRHIWLYFVLTRLLVYLFTRLLPDTTLYISLPRQRVGKRSGLLAGWPPCRRCAPERAAGRGRGRRCRPRGKARRCAH